MQFINIHEAKTNLSKYLKLIQLGNHSVVICSNGKPIATLNEYKYTNKRKLGLCKGQINISEDFDDLPAEIEEYFK